MFDEPTTLIDPSTKKEYFQHIKNLKKLNKIIVLSSHKIVELENNVDEFIIVHKGKVELKPNNSATRMKINEMW